ncbi:MAG: hypothetical protein IJ789_00540 [Bacteroidales bacterium]|nr:hypothetical protein [Bacteroidales bacterium]
MSATHRSCPLAAKVLVLVVAIAIASASSPLAAQEVLTRTDDGRLVSSLHPISNDQGQMGWSVKYTYDSAGVVQSRTLTRYDRAGHAVRRSVYTADDELLSDERSRYDRRGNLRTHTINTYSNGRRTSHHTTRFSKPKKEQ